jgi:hypothetical protein
MSPAFLGGVAACLWLSVIAAAWAADASLAPAPPSVPAIFQGADLALGRRLIAEHRCTECHRQKVGGDGHAMYRPLGRINSPGRLRGMVEQCNTALNLALFPDEVTAVAAVLNRDHYRLRD